MRLTPFLKTYLTTHLGAYYTNTLWEDLQAVISLYDVYDGDGQLWETAAGLDYTPTKRITNHIKHLIKEEARFMFSRPPEITIVPSQKGENEDEANKKLCGELEGYIREVLEHSGWQSKLAKAGRDCFIGKRVALKVIGRKGKLPLVQFKPSLEFFHDVEYDDQDNLIRIIFSYNRNNETDPIKQRIWVQTYYMENGGCFLDEALYNGTGDIVEPEKARKHEAVGLPYIPVFVIINDGLTGDSIGESDVDALVSLAKAYNQVTSDDQDALKFSMFPQRVFIDGSEASLENVSVAPGSMIDLQSDPTANGGRQASAQMLESGFNYDSRIENHIERIKTDMYELLSVPKATTEDYKGIGMSGKAMRALYWPLITRCEEKWATWDTALKWMVRCIIDMENMHVNKRFEKARFIISIEHLFPITDDEEDERKLDLSEVINDARSVISYIEKWRPNDKAAEEYDRIVQERRAREDPYTEAVRRELDTS